MWKKIHTVVPHLLFLVLSLIIVQPSLSGTKGYFPFLFVVFASEAILLLFRKSPVAVNIGIILYCILIFWEIMTAKIGVKNSMLYPAPENVFSVFLGDHQKILQGVFSSLQLLFIAFIIATVLGVSLGLFVGLSDHLSGIVLPIVRVISPIPPIIYSPYAVALLPTFRVAAIFVVTLTIFWSLFMNMVLSVREIDPKIMNSAKTLNVSKFSMIVDVLIPYSLPGLINSISVSISTSFLVLTAAEMIGGTSGLGWYIKYHSDFANFDKVVFGIFMLGLVVTILNFGVKSLRRVLVPWK